MRFCSKCGKLEDVSAFRESRRTCLVQLAQHNKARRERYHSSQPPLRKHGRRAVAGAASPSLAALPGELTALVQLWMETDEMPGLSLDTVDALAEYSVGDNSSASLLSLASELCLSEGSQAVHGRHLGGEDTW